MKASTLAQVKQFFRAQCWPSQHLHFTLCM